ncbi:Nucleoside permease NupG [Klebsiella pneumoniae]|nr:Nucleoside permease NupG [Klebsiella pneumoniae]
MNLKLQLKILSFLQFCLWGSWLTTLGSYMFVTLKFDGAAIGAVYSSLGIAAVLMPTLLGIVAISGSAPNGYTPSATWSAR